MLKSLNILKVIDIFLINSSHSPCELQNETSLAQLCSKMSVTLTYLEVMGDRSILKIASVLVMMTLI